MNTTVKLYSLDYRDAKTYLVALSFVSGNLALPQLFHLLPQGGITWLPIYFFTLIGAYKYGWRVGLLTAVLSPVINSWLFGMPLPEVLPSILLKSVLLAAAASYAAHYYRRISLPVLAMVILFYQIAGTLGEWAMTKDFLLAVQDFRIGLPGMGMQLFGGYWIIKHLL